MNLDELRALGARSPVVPVLGTQPRPPVAHSRELDRILAIPVHLGYSDDLRAEVEDALRVPGGSMRLRPSQADALLAAVEAGGLFAPLSVGAGKTLIAALLPSLFPERARPVVLTTAALARQAEVLIAGYREHWRIREDLQIVPYSTLSSTDASALLEDLAPDLVIADEGHALRDKDSARTKRFLRYMKGHPNTMFCVLSGTLMKRSIKDFATLIGLALGDWTPVPRDWPTLTEWAEALDLEPVRHRGALVRLVDATCVGCGHPMTWHDGECGACSCDHFEPVPPTISEVREAFARRVATTRGVVSSPPEALGASLVIRVVKTPEVPAIRRARLDLAKTWERPDGEELTTAMEVASVDRQLRLGGCYLWATPPAPEWLRARREWYRAVRGWLRDHAREGLDSPALLERAIDRREVAEDLHGLLGEWRRVRAEYPEPPRVWKWIDRGIIEHVRKLRGDMVLDALFQPVITRPDPIIFADLVEPGRALAEACEAPHYGGGPEDAARILDEDGSRSIVCSLQAHGQGRNLQAFSRALVLGGPPSGAVWEQLLGRLHRSGQDADEVEYIVLDLFAEELRRAVEDARHLAASTGAPQKLLTASIVWEAST